MIDIYPTEQPSSIDSGNPLRDSFLTAIVNDHRHGASMIFPHDLLAEQLPQANHRDFIRLNGGIIITATINSWFLTIRPDLYSVSMEAWARVLTLKEYFYDNPREFITITTEGLACHHQDTTQLWETLNDIIMMIETPPNTQTWHDFVLAGKTLYNVVGGSWKQYHYHNLIPRFTNKKNREIELYSCYGPVHFDGQTNIFPIGGYDATFIRFPEATQFFTQQEIDTLTSQEDIWLHKGQLTLDIEKHKAATRKLRACKRITNFRFVEPYDPEQPLDHPWESRSIFVYDSEDFREYDSVYEKYFRQGLDVKHLLDPYVFFKDI